MQPTGSRRGESAPRPAFGLIVAWTLIVGVVGGLGGAVPTAAQSAGSPSAPTQEDEAASEKVEVRDYLTRDILIDHRAAAESAAKRGGQVLEYEWRLGGFLGAIAGLFLPNRGDALVTFVPEPGEEQIEIQVLITAPRRDGEYFLYGAAIDSRDGDTTAVWSSYAYGKGHGKDREQDVEEPDVIDFASAIHYLRHHRPQQPLEMKIWNNGKIYPALVEPLGRETRTVGGQPMELEGFAVVGIVRPGEPSFDDKYFLYFDDQGIPAQILGRRGLIRLRLDLVDRYPSTVALDAEPGKGSGASPRSAR